MRRFSVSCVLYLAFASVACGAETESLHPAQDYRAKRSEPVQHDVDFSIVVTPPYHTHKLQVWVPVPQTSAGQEIGSSEWSTFPLDVTPTIHVEPKYGNKFAYFEFDDPQGAQIIRHRFQAKVWQLDWKIDPLQVRTVDSWPTAFDKYRGGESQAVVVDERFSKLAEEVVPTLGNPLDNMESIMDYVIRDFRYDHVDASLQASSLHALTNRHGHCSDYHGFCASMGRALGYPTRVTYGLSLFPKNSPSHCKLEAFLPPYGWVSFDVSETQKLMASIQQDEMIGAEEKNQLLAAAKNRLTSGFRENAWLLQTQGTDYELAPKASRPVPVVRTAYVEADGVPLPEPDPANVEKKEFAWMTAHKYVADREVVNSFKDRETLNAYTK
ncbi:transglutaminase domain-containing protein [Blastopirellula sp. JC732]|uniref:Transglutaminase domain-containing protein n=1 Tax=Blastopirellula sediminis TaxID=2894196 RepID=A0A9X1MNK6_9BACT|nr:transglutaminase domain-containing protein [Blastopirellula sediminis]MCC9607525.1 transglutaminase domain-containing protein [Blastopirellula sediminis]MCC9629182.1 transglutaminase domain-containing protein [Blastopirellula sediminis]